MPWSLAGSVNDSAGREGIKTAIVGAARASQCALKVPLATRKEYGSLVARAVLDSYPVAGCRPGRFFKELAGYSGQSILKCCAKQSLIR